MVFAPPFAPNLVPPLAPPRPPPRGAPRPLGAPRPPPLPPRSPNPPGKKALAIAPRTQRNRLTDCKHNDMIVMQPSSDSHRRRGPTSTSTARCTTSASTKTTSISSSRSSTVSAATSGCECHLLGNLWMMENYDNSIGFWISGYFVPDSGNCNICD